MSYKLDECPLFIKRMEDFKRYCEDSIRKRNLLEDASPDLLEACEEVLHILKDDYNEHRDCFATNLLLNAVNKAKGV